MELLKDRFSGYASQIGAPARLAEFREKPSDSGAAHVERDGADFCYVVTERGRELERRRTKDSDRLLYWLLSDITHEMASSYAAKNKLGGSDFRATLFQKQLQLLGLIKEDWRAKRADEICEILEKNP